MNLNIYRFIILHNFTYRYGKTSSRELLDIKKKKKKIDIK